MGRRVLKVKKDTLNLTVAHPDHAYALAPHLREADKKEINAYYPDEDHGHVLQYGIETSDQCFTINYGKTIHGLWGHGSWTSGGPLPGVTGFIWMLTDEILFKRHSLALTRTARKVIFPQLDKVYGTYGNWVHSDNHVHLRWLLRAGFKDCGSSLINGNPFSLLLRSADV